MQKLKAQFLNRSPSPGRRLIIDIAPGTERELAEKLRPIFKEMGYDLDFGRCNY